MYKNTDVISKDKVDVFNKIIKLCTEAIESEYNFKNKLVEANCCQKSNQFITKN